MSKKDFVTTYIVFDNSIKLSDCQNLEAHPQANLDVSQAKEETPATKFDNGLAMGHKPKLVRKGIYLTAFTFR